MIPSSSALGGHSVTAASAPRRFGSLLSTMLAPFARRYIAGITLTTALEKLALLKRAGFSTTLDHLGESVLSADEARIAAEQCVLMLKALKERDLDRNISLKLSQLGLAIDADLARRHLKEIVTAAEAVNGFVRVDMEGSDMTDATLSLVREMKTSRIVPVGVVVQAMLKRTPTDVVELLQREITLRLCKGAYKESPAVAYTQMSDIRTQFLALAKRLMTAPMVHGLATHDPKLIGSIMEFARAQGIGPDRFEFQMLLGIRTRLQERIVREGWKLRVYVPFGQAWLPYTWRRIREKKENLLCVLTGMWS